MSELEKTISLAIRQERQRAAEHRGSNGADALARSVARMLVDEAMVTGSVHLDHLKLRGKF